MTAGAGECSEAAGYQRDQRPFVISIGAMADGLPLVRDGWIDSTIMQSPKEEAQTGRECRPQIAFGKAIRVLHELFSGPHSGRSGQCG